MRDYLLPEEKEGDKLSDVLRLLSGVDMRGRATCPIRDHVVVVEPDKLQRRIVTSQLKGIDCRFHSTETHKKAQQILERDGLVRLVLLDCDRLGHDLIGTVAAIREIRSDVTIVGTTINISNLDAERVGVDALLRKPFLAASLVDLLTEQEAEHLVSVNSA